MKTRTTGVDQLAATRAESPTTATTRSSASASFERGAEAPERVHPTGTRVDERGVVIGPTPLHLLGTTVVVDAEHDGGEPAAAIAAARKSVERPR